MDSSQKPGSSIEPVLTGTPECIPEEPHVITTEPPISSTNIEPSNTTTKSENSSDIETSIKEEPSSPKEPSLSLSTKEPPSTKEEEADEPSTTTKESTGPEYASVVKIKNTILEPESKEPDRTEDQPKFEPKFDTNFTVPKIEEPIVRQPTSQPHSLEPLPVELPHPIPPARRQSQPFTAGSLLGERKKSLQPSSLRSGGLLGSPSSNNSYNFHNNTVFAPPTTMGPPPEAPKRRVSIASDVTVAHCPSGGAGGYDNPAFEPALHPRRKISAVSQHSTHEEIGPVRKKSILHNAQHSAAATAPHPDHDSHNHMGGTELRHNGGSIRSNKSSAVNSVYSKHEQESLESSWIYVCCSKCRGEESASSWEPPNWQKFCPYPLCPSYRQFARILSLILLGLLGWGTVYAILGDTAAPGGALFGLAALTVAAHFGGWLMQLTTLPALIGMLVVGIIFQNVGLVNLDELHHLVSELRKFALVIILTRAGLEMDPGAFKKLYGVILKLGLVPWTIEAGIVAVTSHFLLDLPWLWGLLLGSIVAAVSPAVVVPCLFRLRGKGYGVAKGIPTLIIAVAGIDDAASVAIFGIISSIMFSNDSLAFQIAQGPISVIGGIGFGVFWGWLAKYVPERGDPFVVPLRTLMLFGGGLIAVFGSESIGFEGAGPLAVVAAAFVSCYFWSQQGWEVEDNPVSTAFEIFWMIFEPILFGITGAGVKLDELEGTIVSLGIACLASGIIIRIACTVLVAIRCRLNLKEKFFVALSWMSKATVQAALGPVALATLQNGSEQDKHYAEVVLMVCVLSIIVTAPLGAILISISGPRLLTKTRQPQIIEGWRRSHRPSLRDISIIDEEEERDDLDDVPASEYNDATAHNTSANAATSITSAPAPVGRPLPNYEA